MTVATFFFKTQGGKTKKKTKNKNLLSLSITKREVDEEDSFEIYSKKRMQKEKKRCKKAKKTKIDNKIKTSETAERTQEKQSKEYKIVKNTDRNTNVTQRKDILE